MVLLLPMVFELLSSSLGSNNVHKPVQNNLILLVFGLSSTLAPILSHAQTCCTGAAQITGNISTSPPSSQQWTASILADYNNNSTLIQGDVVTDDDYLQRSTTTWLVQAGYGINDRFGLSVLMPYVILQESVDVVQPLHRRNHAAGDLMLFGSALLINKERFTINGGLGVKLPTGPSQKIDEKTQIILSPTLQAGTGSIDYISQLHAQYSFKALRSLAIWQTISYRLNTESHRLAGHDNYKFGNEFISLTTLSNQFVAGSVIMLPFISFMYRYAGQNMIEGFADPNSGGHWINLRPGFSLTPIPDTTFSVFGELPINRQLNGFQLTTTYRITASLQYNF